MLLDSSRLGGQCALPDKIPGPMRSIDHSASPRRRIFNGTAACLVRWVRRRAASNCLGLSRKQAASLLFAHDVSRRRIHIRRDHEYLFWMVIRMNTFTAVPDG